MRRYLPLLLIAFFLLVSALAGTTYLDIHAGKQKADNIKNITVYTTSPAEQVLQLAREYEKAFNIHLNIVPLSDNDLLARLKNPESNIQADIVLASSDILQQAVKLNALLAYTSEHTDIVPDKFKDDNDYWVGTWFDPIVFVANQDSLKEIPQIPTKWDDLADNKKLRLSFTDFLAAKASANMLYTLAAVNGEQQTLKYLKKIHPQVIQYSKFLSTPVRMAGMGEADVAIAVQSEAIRYAQDDFPIKIIYPEDGTAFLLTGIGLVKGATHGADAKHFIDWLLKPSTQAIMQNNKFYFVSTNPEITPYKDFRGKTVNLFEEEETLTPKQQQEILEKWVQTVRLEPK